MVKQKHNYYKIRVSKTSIEKNLLFIMDLLKKQKIINNSNYSVLYFYDDILSLTIIKSNIFEKKYIFKFSKEISIDSTKTFLFFIVPQTSVKLTIWQKIKIKQLLPKHTIYISLIPENKKMTKISSITNFFIDGHFCLPD